MDGDDQQSRDVVEKDVNGSDLVRTTQASTITISTFFSEQTVPYMCR